MSDSQDTPRIDEGGDGESRATAVETYVEPERGQWRVDLAVFFDDEVVVRTINTYRTERKATVAASWIRRAAERDIRGPVHGME